MNTFAKLDYPKDRYRIISIPNSNDLETIKSLRRLQKEFPFLEIMEVPPTTDPSWQIIWDNWESNQKAYWWHFDRHAKDKNLPPKKTRQLIYCFYHLAKEFEGKEDFLINYLDADSCLPHDHFLAGAVGIKQYDVLQATNIAGNLNDTWAASCHAFDHFMWDGLKYPHLSSNGTHPYWVLGKALFFKASDLLELGGFHPWITIEDPEVGMRFWMNGKRLGIIEKPVIEEVPDTISKGFLQRKRWVCGFFQSLTTPLTRLGMSPWQKFKAWLNFIPCLGFWVNTVGIPTGVWALWKFYCGSDFLPIWVVILSVFNIVAFLLLNIFYYVKIWNRTALVLDTTRSRLWYLFRMNPLASMIWWIMWLIPIYQGLRMYLGEGGLIWERTEKIDANAKLFQRRWRGFSDWWNS